MQSLNIAKVNAELRAYPSYGAVEAQDPFEPLIVSSPGDGLIGLTGTSHTFASNGGISIYPNPIHENHFNLSVSALSLISKIKVYDLTGKTVGINVMESSQGIYRIEFSNTPVAGYYILKVDDYAQKLLVQ